MTASTFTTANAANLNTVLQGDCVQIMRGMQPGSIDFVITDPLYMGPGKDSCGIVTQSSSQISRGCCAGKRWNRRANPI